MSKIPRVLVGITLNEDAMKRLKQVVDVDVVKEDFIQNKGNLLKIIGNYEGVIVSQPIFDKEVISEAKKLKIISRRGVGYDSIDVKSATERGI
ncbi:MAG: D-3-phosphoglycerate dehydrogenase / 2-oxoglutarate reductase [Thermoproteota archaeon]|nr:D-3-phosphoglycerate dehydrogenase / 2-oxoglutarate reductase [Thermoproteota archaeon]